MHAHMRARLSSSYWLWCHRQLEKSSACSSNACDDVTESSFAKFAKEKNKHPEEEKFRHVHAVDRRRSSRQLASSYADLSIGSLDLGSKRRDWKLRQAEAISN